jgi:hypothetical protein
MIEFIKTTLSGSSNRKFSFSQSRISSAYYSLLRLNIHSVSQSADALKSNHIPVSKQGHRVNVKLATAALKPKISKGIMLLHSFSPPTQSPRRSTSGWEPAA